MARILVLVPLVFGSESRLIPGSIPGMALPVTRVSKRYAEVQVLSKVSAPARIELTHGHWLLRPWLLDTYGNRNA